MQPRGTARTSGKSDGMALLSLQIQHDDGVGAVGAVGAVVFWQSLAYSVTYRVVRPRGLAWFPQFTATTGTDSYLHYTLGHQV